MNNSISSATIISLPIKLNIFMSSIDCTWTSSWVSVCPLRALTYASSYREKECIVMHSSAIQLTYSPLISNSSVNVSSLEIHGRFCQDIRHLNKPQILTSKDLHASVHRKVNMYMRKGCQSQTRTFLKSLLGNPAGEKMQSWPL